MMILASTSQTRHTLLRNAGIEFRAVAPLVDEQTLIAANPQWRGRDVSHQLAKAKAVAVSHIHPDVPVIGADQVLTADGKLFSKPRDLTECRHQLEQLRGRTHSLVSTACCAHGGTEIWSCTQTAHLKMRDFSDSFLDDYLLSPAVNHTSSVGGYQVEGLGVQLFDSIEGDYFAILGLPLIPLLHHLRFIGVIAS